MVRNNSKNFRNNSTKHRNCFENIEQSNYRKWVLDRANEQCTTSSLNNIFKEKIKFSKLMRVERGIRVLGEDETISPKRKIKSIKKKKITKKKNSK